MTSAGRFALVLLPLAAAIVSAPASWLAAAMASVSDGRIRLADAEGFWWRGSAWLALAPAPGAGAAVVLPGRFRWSLAPLSGGIALDGAPWIVQPFIVTWRGRADLTPGALRLPAEALAAFGPPLATLRPRGTLEVAWQDAAHVTVDWRDAATALAALPRVGDYRLERAGDRLRLTTLKGPLLLEGESPDGRRFTGTARSEPEAAARLANLLTLLGPGRDGITLLRY
jgi:general secretion pathway protein N